MKNGILAMLLFLLAVSAGTVIHAQPDNRNPYNLPMILTTSEYSRMVNANPAMQMADIENVDPRIRLDIRYATKDNFTGQVIYKAPKAFLRSPVAAALKKVQDSLSFYKAGLKIWDAYRPYAASIRFFEVYPDTNFVANPRYGSRHNRGCAVDLTLVELKSGRELPMPTSFDDFSPKANPAYASLPDTVLSNRTLLFGIMAHFGFTHIESEWWHFDFTGWQGYPLMDLTFDELEQAETLNQRP